MQQPPQPQRLNPLGPPPPQPTQAAQPAQPPQPTGAQASSARPGVSRTSHVTAVDPALSEGHNFDPRIRAQYANEPAVVHATRGLEIEPRPISDQLQQKHEESMRRYPHLNLSEGEYVILAIKRHPIGMLMPAAATGGLLLALGIFTALYPVLSQSVTVDVMPSFGMFLLAMIPLALLVVLGGAIALWVYLQNQFYDGKV